ncbi:hypothetical protein KIPB_008410 [Kipferlia bialata]|uniref:Uncharacterized protein n=1 Tax=Kipferlia bialata TaxID=797122 RepID=A0A9K3D0M7_9EUKA|nr:hypothetical protein KIPB_008410 [Kipferlia bialata]|eukprot:g8410.t1
MFGGSMSPSVGERVERERERVERERERERERPDIDNSDTESEVEGEGEGEREGEGDYETGIPTFSVRQWGRESETVPVETDEGEREREYEDYAPMPVAVVQREAEGVREREPVGEYSDSEGYLREGEREREAERETVSEEYSGPYDSDVEGSYDMDESVTEREREVDALVREEGGQGEGEGEGEGDSEEERQGLSDVSDSDEISFECSSDGAGERAEQEALRQIQEQRHAELERLQREMERERELEAGRERERDAEAYAAQERERERERERLAEEEKARALALQLEKEREQEEREERALMKTRNLCLVRDFTDSESALQQTLAQLNRRSHFEAQAKVKQPQGTVTRRPKKGAYDISVKETSGVYRDGARCNMHMREGAQYMGVNYLHLLKPLARDVFTPEDPLSLSLPEDSGRDAYETQYTQYQSRMRVYASSGIRWTQPSSTVSPYYTEGEGERETAADGGWLGDVPYCVFLSHIARHMPQQCNSCDCGVFSLLAMRFGLGLMPMFLDMEGGAGARSMILHELATRRVIATPPTAMGDMYMDSTT